MFRSERASEHAKSPRPCKTGGAPPQRKNGTPQNLGGPQYDMATSYVAGQDPQSDIMEYVIAPAHDTMRGIAEALRQFVSVPWNERRMKPIEDLMEDIVAAVVIFILLLLFLRACELYLPRSCATSSEEIDWLTISVDGENESDVAGDEQVVYLSKLLKWVYSLRPGHPALILPSIPGQLGPVFGQDEELGPIVATSRGRQRKERIALVLQGRLTQAMRRARQQGGRVSTRAEQGERAEHDAIRLALGKPSNSNPSRASSRDGGQQERRLELPQPATLPHPSMGKVHAQQMY